MANPVSKPVLDWTFTAGEDLSGKQFCFVELATDGDVEACDAITDVPVGILQNKPKSGEQALVRVIGVSKLKINGTSALNPGTRVGPHTNGRGVTAVATAYPSAVVLQKNATTSGSPATVLVDCIAQSLMA